MNSVFLLAVAHVATALISALVLTRAVRATQKRPLLALFLGVCLFVPLLGPAGLYACVVLPLNQVRRANLCRGSSLTGIPALPADPPRGERQLENAASLRAVLARSGDKEGRLKALTETRRWDDCSAVPRLLSALRDPSDDVRLLAYGLLDGRLQRSVERVESARQVIAGVSDTDRAPLNRRLAMDLWELVRAGLVRGSAADQALAEARRRAESALATQPDDAALHFLHGRILLRQADDAAAHALHAGLLHGLPGDLVAPYLAEAAFQRRAFDEVSGLLGSDAGGRSHPRMSRLRAFWCHSSEKEPQIHISRIPG